MINRSRKHGDTARLSTINRVATIELRLALFSISGCGEPFIPLQAHCGGTRCTHVSPPDVAVCGRREANVLQGRFGCLLTFCRTATVVRRTSHGEYSVVCGRSSIGRHVAHVLSSAETILRCSVVLLVWRTADNRVVVS